MRAARARARSDAGAKSGTGATSGADVRSATKGATASGATSSAAIIRAATTSAGAIAGTSRATTSPPAGRAAATPGGRRMRRCAGTIAADTTRGSMRRNGPGRSGPACSPTARAAACWSNVSARRSRNPRSARRAASASGHHARAAPAGRTARAGRDRPTRGSASDAWRRHTRHTLMRVVGGRLRGRALAAPKGQTIRPTSDRLRESLFNILAHAYGDPVTGARVLDLFAGTGALGIEAISRGAPFCLFVDDGTEARALIRQNVDALGLGQV